PAVALERVEDPSADDGANRHAEAREHRRRAEHRAHDALAEVLAGEDRVQRHHAAVRQAENNGEQVELAGPADRGIGGDGESLYQQTGYENPLHAEAVRRHAEHKPPAKPRQSLDAVHADGRHGRKAAELRVTHHVEDRARVCRASEEERGAEREELRREQRAPELRAWRASDRIARTTRSRGGRWRI